MVEERNLATTHHDTSSFELMDALDDEQTLAEIQGKVIEDYVYSVDGQYQLSKAGVNWACREYAKKKEIIRVIGHPQGIADPGDPEYVLVTTLAQRFALDEKGHEIGLDTYVGAKRQWRKMRLKDGSIVPNVYWWEHAVSKSQRNSRLGLMEADFIAKVIQVAIEKKKVKNVLPPATTQAKNASVPAAPAKSPTKEAPPKQAAAAEAPSKQTTDKSSPQTRQRVFGMLAVLGYKSHEDQKRVFQVFLPGYASSKEVPEAVLARFLAALHSVKDGAFKLRMDADGEKIVDPSSDDILFPRVEKTDAASSLAEKKEEEPF